MQSKIVYFLFCLFFFLSLAQNVNAIQACDIVHQEGIVPCQLTGANRCTLCHFFQMLERIINYLLFCLIPPVAIFMLVLGGLMYIGGVLEFLPGGISTVSQAKRLFVSVAIGLFISYGAWLIIHLFLNALGYTRAGNWWEIECQITSAPTSQTFVSAPTTTITNLAASQLPTNLANLISTSLLE